MNWLANVLFPELVAEVMALRATVNALEQPTQGKPRSLDCGHVDTTWSKDHDGITRCRHCHSHYIERSPR
jgi:hypothetical protein